MKYKALVPALAAAALILPTENALAVKQGDWLVRFGAAQVSPNDGSSGVVAPDAIGVEDDTQAFINLTYMLKDNIGLEILGATPFTHDITLAGSGKIAETKHLPPTFSIQYHFQPKESVRPYVGAGINYTTFFNTKTFGALEGTDLDLDDSFGLAGEIGADIILNDTWFLNASFRYIDIETDAKLDGAKLGAVKIDPYVYGIHVGMKF